MAGIYSSC